MASFHHWWRHRTSFFWTNWTYFLQSKKNTQNRHSWHQFRKEIVRGSWYWLSFVFRTSSEYTRPQWAQKSWGRLRTSWTGCDQFKTSLRHPNDIYAHWTIIFVRFSREIEFFKLLWLNKMKAQWRMKGAKNYNSPCDRQSSYTFFSYSPVRKSVGVHHLQIVNHL